MIRSFGSVVLKLSVPFLLLLAAGEVGYSQSVDHISKSQKLAAAYSDTILSAFKEDLEPIEYDEGYDRTRRCLEAMLSDTGFESTFYCKLSRSFYSASEYRIDLQYRDESIDSGPERRIPVYVFLPGHDNTKATLVSYRALDEPLLLALPREIVSYSTHVDSIITANRDTTQILEEETLRISGDSLKQLFPEFSTMQFWLLTEDSTKVSTVSALEFVLCTYGANQIFAEFDKPLQSAVIAVPRNAIKSGPRLQKVDGRSSPHPFDNSKELTFIPLPNGLIYAGSPGPDPITLDLLWDQSRSILLRAKGYFGECMGNYRPIFDANYLIQLDGTFVVLRVDEQYANLVHTTLDLRVETIADETAPEL